LREQGLPLAVATNAERPIAQRSLGAIGAQNLFETLVSITDDVPPKPAPLMFQKAAQHLGHTGRNVLVVEDSEQGVRAAQDAGMSVICLTR
jgi:HAD superfamily hydrolase (TIGR01509 family)